MSSRAVWSGGYSRAKNISVVFLIALLAAPAPASAQQPAPPPYPASRGGIPLIQDGKLIGAIGCSGGTGSQDGVVCAAGAATINK